MHLPGWIIEDDRLWRSSIERMKRVAVGHLLQSAPLPTKRDRRCTATLSSLNSAHSRFVHLVFGGFMKLRAGTLAIILSGVLLSVSAAQQQPQQSQPAPQTQSGQAAGQSSPSAALHVYAYPSNNQSPSQQSKDEGECFQWAKAQNSQAPDQSASAGEEQKNPSDAGKGAGAKGAAKGAAGGAAIGAIAGDAGAGAGIGAVAGTAGGRRQKKKAEKEAEQQQQQQQQAQQAQGMDNLKRAYSACMESRHYTVK